MLSICDLIWLTLAFIESEFPSPFIIVVLSLSVTIFSQLPNLSILDVSKERHLSSEITVPFDWAKAQKVEGVVSFYTTRNLLYIGIGEYDFLSRYHCKAAFLNASGEKSQYAVY